MQKQAETPRSKLSFTLYLFWLELVLWVVFTTSCAAMHAQQPNYQFSFVRPSIDCVLSEHEIGRMDVWACPQNEVQGSGYGKGITLAAVNGHMQQVTNVTAHYTTNGHAILPDPKVTPGKARTTDKNDPVVCGGKSTKTVRKPGIQSVYKAYGAVKKAGVCCEIDHLISLELGGANDVLNEWPQPYLPKPGAHEKDEVENWLHAQVCSGKMALIDAQQQISTDWYKIYLQMPKH